MRRASLHHRSRGCRTRHLARQTGRSHARLCENRRGRGGRKPRGIGEYEEGHERGCLYPSAESIPLRETLRRAIDVVFLRSAIGCRESGVKRRILSLFSWELHRQPNHFRGIAPRSVDSSTLICRGAVRRSEPHCSAINEITRSAASSIVCRETVLMHSR